MRSRAFLAVLAATVLSFGGYALLLPVVPLHAAAGGAGPGAAGATTGVFMAATVAAQLAVPAVLRRAGPRTALVAGALALGVPAALLPLSTALPLLLAVAVVRGAGFGLLTVTGAALVADLVPAARRGRAAGLYGAAVGLPQLVLLSGGVGAYVVLGATPVLLVGAALPLIAVPVARLVPARTAPRTAPVSSAVTSTVAARGSAWLGWGAVAPWAAMVVAAAAAGGVLTVLPLWGEAAPAGPSGLAGGTATAAIALFTLTAGQLVGRSLAGELADRRSARRPGALTAIGLGVAAAGGAVVAGGGTGSGVVVVLGATLVGLGFGTVQSDTLLALFARAGPARSGLASTWWNTGYDSGTGIGAATLGALLGAAGGPAAFVVAGLACLLVLPCALLTRPDADGPRSRVGGAAAG